MNVSQLKMIKQLLIETRHTVNNIAVRVGYRDGPAMTRPFKEAMGLTPTQYRRKHRRDPAYQLSPYVLDHTKLKILISSSPGTGHLSGVLNKQLSLKHPGDVLTGMVVHQAVLNDNGIFDVLSPMVNTHERQIRGWVDLHVPTRFRGHDADVRLVYIPYKSIFIADIKYPDFTPKLDTHFGVHLELNATVWLN